MNEGYWVIRTHRAGAVEEKTKFFVPGKRPDKKLSRKQKEKIKKQAQNEYSAVKRLARILNKYFSAGDIFLGLDYSADGMQKLDRWAVDKGVPVDSLSGEELRDVRYEAADHELTNCLRRAQRRAKAAGVELKAVMTNSDLEWSKKDECYKPARVHHHLVINKEALPFFEAAWKGMGRVDREPLYANQEDRTELAEYMLRQVRKIPDDKKFRTTRNLPPIEPKDRIVHTNAELKVPRGGQLLFRNEYSRNAPQYIRYIIPKYGQAAADFRSAECEERSLE